MLKAMINPASRKNVITSSAGTTPTKTYERISFRRTRHSSRRLAHTASRVNPYATPNSSARLPTMSMASSHPGSVSTKPSGQVIALIAMPSTSARPGKVLSSHRRQACHRDGMSPGSNAGGRTDSLIGRLPEYPFSITENTEQDGAHGETQRHRTVQHDLHSCRAGTRPRHRRHHHADLSDLDLRAGWPRPAACRLRVRPHAESDAHDARAQHRRHRSRDGGVCVRLGDGGDRYALDATGVWRPRPGRRQHLRRHLPPLRARAAQVRP